MMRRIALYAVAGLTIGYSSYLTNYVRAAYYQAKIDGMLRRLHDPIGVFVASQAATKFSLETGTAVSDARGEMSGPDVTIASVDKVTNDLKDWHSFARAAIGVEDTEKKFTALDHLRQSLSWCDGLSRPRPAPVVQTIPTSAI